MRAAQAGVRVTLGRMNRLVRANWPERSKHMGSTNPSNSEWPVLWGVFFACVAGVGVALWLPGEQVPKVVGAFCVASGLCLFLLRNVFTRDPDRLAIEELMAAERQARIRMRIAGASVVLLGMAQFVPDLWGRTAVMSCAAAVSFAGVFKVPRRLFVPKGPTG
jgi:hypothetical protein